MRDPGELITKTLVREFAEEALSHDLVYNNTNQIEVSAGDIEKKLSEFFRNGIQIYKGYVDDPRNTGILKEKIFLNE
jgi:ADP-ribose pyrophosphatase